MTPHNLFRKVIYLFLTGPIFVEHLLIILKLNLIKTKT
jgi:hypothetical protein